MELSESVRESVKKQLTEANQKISKHPVQVHILRQISEQLKKYASFASEEKHEDIADKMNISRETVEQILATKTEIKEREDEFIKILNSEIDNVLGSDIAYGL